MCVWCYRYTFKAVGAGFYGLRTAKDFLSCLRKVIAEAGDADRLVTPVSLYLFILLSLSLSTPLPIHLLLLLSVMVLSVVL